MSAVDTAGGLPVLALRDLSLSFVNRSAVFAALTEVTLEIAAGEIVGLVGESGSGKSITAMSVLRLLPEKVARFAASSRIVVLGRDVLAMNASALRALRGRDVSMVFQEPMAALNPVLRIRTQMLEILRRHEKQTAAVAERRACELLRDMQLPDPERVLTAFPHELSGGMRQRVLIAMAFACNPRLIIADEATTALDVTLQARILGLLRDRARAIGTSVLLITHDLAVVSELCHRTYVMHRGRIVESGLTAAVITRPQHAYTRALLDALPNGKMPRTRLVTGAAALREPAGARRNETVAEPEAELHAEPAAEPEIEVPVVRWSKRAAPGAVPALEAREIVVRYARDHDVLGRPTAFHTAVDRVSLSVSQGETVSIVGESGCGKSSLANALVGLVPVDGGSVRYLGVDLPQVSVEKRRELQIVFQDPMSSLDPRWPIWRTLTEPLTVGGAASRRERRTVARELCAMVGLDPTTIERLPHEFSGGQRQRIAIGRALSVEPRVVILDEPTSALDVSVQAQILNLLLDLQDRRGLAYLFISHNLGVVRHVADRIAVMLEGGIVEEGPTDQVISAPQHEYTRSLLAAVPRLYTHGSPRGGFGAC